MPAADRFQGRDPEALLVSITHGEAIAPSDTVEFTNASRAIYVGAGGNLVVVLISGDELTLKNVPSGSLLPLRAKRVASTNTTAADLVALY